MPFGGRLTDQQIATVKAWIDQGAEWDPAVTSPEIQCTCSEAVYRSGSGSIGRSNLWPNPRSRDIKCGDPIDAFVQAKLEENKLKPNPRADKITLLRRATLDLTGLPPTPDEVQASYRTIRPRHSRRSSTGCWLRRMYGERWGRHWLDLARYADSNGFKADEVEAQHLAVSRLRHPIVQRR